MAATAPDPPAPPVASGVLHALQPAPGQRLSGGTAIAASILARLLGIRLLRLDAQIALVPATIDAPRPSAPQLALSAAPPGQSDLDEAARLLARASRTIDETKHAAADGYPVR